MIKDIKKDHLIGSFLDSLYIEKGLSKNTVSSYKNDISSLIFKYLFATHLVPQRPQSAPGTHKCFKNDPKSAKNDLESDPEQAFIGYSYTGP